MTDFIEMENKTMVDTITVPAGSAKPFERLVLVVVLLLVFIGAARAPVDTDLWWHLRSGQIEWQTASPLLTETFSFTRPGESWTNHSWLAEAILFGIFKVGGYLGLTLYTAILATTAMGFAYMQLKGQPLYRAFLIILAMTVAAPMWSPRPQMFSFVFFSVVGFILYLYKWKRQDYLLVLPIIMGFWANLHGGYPLGWMLIGLMLAGEILNHILGYTGKEILPWKQIGNLGIILAVCLVIVVLNPNGPAIWQIPFQTVGVESLQNFIEEWASPDFHLIYQQPFLVLLFGLFAAIGLSGRRVDGGDLLVVIWFGVLSLLARRNMGPFALAVIPVLGRHARSAVQAWMVRMRAREKFNLPKIHNQAGRSVPRKLRIAINLLLVGLLTLAALIKAISVSSPVFIDSVLKTSLPVSALTWMSENGYVGRVFNEYQWGGFIEWFAPSQRVFVDGRTDLFGDDIIGKWMQVTQAGPGWEQVLEEFPADYLLIMPDRPLADAAVNQGWTLLYQDDVAILYGR